MKLDLEIVKQILTAVEEKSASAGPLTWGINPDHLEESHIWLEHCDLLIEEGLLDGKTTCNHMNIPAVVIARRLSMAGHNFLANLKTPTVLNRLKEKITKVGGSMSFTIVQEVAQSLAKRELGLE